MSEAMPDKRRVQASDIFLHWIRQLREWRTPHKSAAEKRRRFGGMAGLL